MTIPIDSHYIPAFSIEDVLLDKDTGAPLTGGLVYFERDKQRGTLKPVYQITGTSPNYTFTALPNPMTLSAIGTFEDSLQNPVIPYFHPYDASLNVDLYYIRVTSSEGVEQFVRQAQPFLGSGGDSTVASLIDNEISNPQFAEVLFDTNAANVVYSVNAVTDHEIPIAPDWSIVVTAAGAGTITVSQVTPAGTLNVITNPGTLLNINSTGLTKLHLRQRIYGSPNLWGNGYISASFVAKTHESTSSVLALYYSQSNGTVTGQLLASATLQGSGNYDVWPGTKLIPVSTSTEDFPDAYIDIYFILPLSTQVDITSVMVAFTGTSPVDNIQYDQESNPRQIDHLFHYYKHGLDLKPTANYLVGWDFPLNPAQLFGEHVAVTNTGANNKSYYSWDQTIIFQTVNNGLEINRLTKDGSMQCSAQADGQIAFIQYLTGNQARGLFVSAALYGISAYVAMASHPVKSFTISLWWTDNASFPDIKLFDSLVTGLDANGYPTVVAGWTELQRFNIGESNKFTNTVDGIVQGFEFPAFIDSAPEAAMADKFAIVIGTSALSTGDIVFFQAASVALGLIPTPPAPQTPDEVLRECQYYFQKSFLTATAPAQNAGFNTGESFGIQVGAAGVTSVGPVVRFPTPMVHTPAVVLYNPSAANAQITSLVGGDWSVSSASALTSITANGFVTSGITNGASVQGQLSAVHWTANAVLGFF